MKSRYSPWFVALGLVLTSGAVVHAAPGDKLARGEPQAPSEPRAMPPHPSLATPESPALALAALDRKIADLDAEEASSKKELGELGPKLAEVHGRTLSRGRAFYKLSRAGMLPVGGGFDALVTHAMRVERSRRALSNDLGEEKRLRMRGGDLARNLERVARDRRRHRAS